MYSLLQLLSLMMLAWFVYGLLSWFGLWLVIGTCLFAGLNAWLTWLLYEKSLIANRLAQLSFIRPLLRFVSRCSGQPMSGGSQSAYRLRRKSEFEAAEVAAKQLVRGHDDVIERLLASAFENQTLRRRNRVGVTVPPLMSFLLVGPEGVGKRYQVSVLAKLLYAQNQVMVFDCRRLDERQLIGTRTEPGRLLRVLEETPHTAILFEHIESASTAVVEVLIALLTGRKLGATDGRAVRAEHATIIGTTTKGVDAMSTIQATSVSHARRQKKAVKALGEQYGIDQQLLNAFGEIAYCEQPDNRVKSEVITLLMKQACRKHHTDLTFVEPEIIACQVLQIGNELGFAVAPQLVEKLLRRPLVEAVEANHRSLSLHIHRT